MLSLGLSVWGAIKLYFCCLMDLFYLYILINQWKAAKEELEDEEEPENAYEILERKREREIKVQYNRTHLIIKFLK